MRSYLAWSLCASLVACRSVVGLTELSFDDDAAAAGAAGSPGDGAGGVSGGAGAGTAGVAGQAGLAGAAGIGGAAGSCDVGPAPNTCAKCERDQCCAEVAACLADAKCVDCVSDPSIPACWDSQAARALLGCANRRCAAACATGGTFCNPISNEGCSGGDACDFNEAGVFTCFPPDNVEPVCAKCDSSGPYCAPGLACLESTCMVYCCDDADCGGGTCDKPSIGAGQLGVCVTSAGAADCKAKLPVASKGACVPR